MTLHRGQAIWGKMASPWGKLTAPSVPPDQKVNKAEEQAHLSTNTAPWLPLHYIYICVVINQKNI
jgi:hypothetical protein